MVDTKCTRTVCNNVGVHEHLARSDKGLLYCNDCVYQITRHEPEFKLFDITSEEAYKRRNEDKVFNTEDRGLFYG